MPLTVYEKNHVMGGMNAIVTGVIDFNVLNQPRTPKPTKLVPNPKPEYVIALSEFAIKGDPQLVAALKETAYADGKKISLRDKSPFPPAVFGSDKQASTGEELIPERKCIKQGTPVKVHVHTFDTPMNVGCGFDAIMFGTPLDQVPVEDAGGSVSADVFDQFDTDTTAVDWNDTSDKKE